MGGRMKDTPTPNDKEHGQQRPAPTRTQAAKKRICAEFKFWHMRSRSRHFTQFEARVMKWEHFGIFALLAAVMYLVATYLAKH